SATTATTPHPTIHRDMRGDLSFVRSAAVAAHHPGGPVARRRAARAEAPRGFPEPLRRLLLLDPKLPVELDHQVPRPLVVDSPERGDRGPHSRGVERRLEGRDPLPRAAKADVRLAGREHG